MRNAGWNTRYPGRCGARMNVSKNQLVCARCHLTGLASGIDWIAQSSADSGTASCSVAARTDAIARRHRRHRPAIAPPTGRDAHAAMAGDRSCGRRPSLPGDGRATSGVDDDARRSGDDLADHRRVIEAIGAKRPQDVVHRLGRTRDQEPPEVCGSASSARVVASMIAVDLVAIACPVAARRAGHQPESRPARPRRATAARDRTRSRRRRRRRGKSPADVRGGRSR